MLGFQNDRNRTDAANALLLLQFARDNRDVYDCRGRTGLHNAVRKADVRLTKSYLKKGANVNVADDTGETPLLAAAESVKSGKLLPLLMKHGADITARNNRGENLLHFLARAPEEEHVDLARTLIEKGISLDDGSDCKPIHMAALNQKDKLIKLFLNHGADVNTRSCERWCTNGVFPLYLVAGGYNSRTDALEALLERGADIHQKTSAGRTALHRACEHHDTYSKFEYIRILLSVGADVLAEDNRGNTPIASIPWSHLEVSADDPTSNYVLLIVKALALREVRRPSVKLKDEWLIKTHRPYWGYYRDCIAHVYRMKFTRFIETCTFFELLTKSHYQIALLMRNPKFKSKNFQLYDLNAFSMYTKDIIEAFEHAEHYYEFMLELEDIINEAVYNILPHMVARKVVRYMLIGCNVYVMKRNKEILRASLGNSDNSIS